MYSGDLYPAILRRRSVRKYDPKALTDDTLEEIRGLISRLKPMREGIKTLYKIVPPEQVRTIGDKAPHYVAALSEVKEGHLSNVGYMLQGLDLALSSSGIGCCWLGIPRPTGEVYRGSGLEFVIFLSFGKPAEPIYRESISEFVRKPTNTISSVVGSGELVEAARLAPSAMNNQGWFFTGGGDVIHAYIRNPGFVRGFFAAKYLGIDVGIAIRHVAVAAEHFGRSVSYAFNAGLDVDPPKGCEYVASIKLGESS